MAIIHLSVVNLETVECPAELLFWTQHFCHEHFHNFLGFFSLLIIWILISLGLDFVEVENFGLFFKAGDLCF